MEQLDIKGSSVQAGMVKYGKWIIDTNTQEGKDLLKEIKSIKKGKGTSLSIVAPPFYNAKDELWEVLPTSILSEEEMHFLELRKMGYKLAEMANITGRTSSYVKRIFYKAIRKIREKNA